MVQGQVNNRFYLSKNPIILAGSGTEYAGAGLPRPLRVGRTLTTQHLLLRHLGRSWPRCARAPTGGLRAASPSACETSLGPDGGVLLVNRGVCALMRGLARGEVRGGRWMDTTQNVL
jgi:hypothetical protein